MDKVLPQVRRIHNPLLPGNPLLLMPERVLVRWPVRVPSPTVGDMFEGVTVAVPGALEPAVWTLLFGTCPLARCDAAKQLAEEPTNRRRILLRIYSRPYVQQLLATANRIEPELRETVEAVGGVVPIRRLTRAAYAPNIVERIRYSRS
ncbi:MAG: hypothetical protein U0441_20300 [Polyangiaceae bacterium]